MCSVRHGIYCTECREKVEENLIFIGLVVMENRLKPQTEGKERRRATTLIHVMIVAGVLKTLARANIRTIMCTGQLIIAFDCVD